MSATKIRTTTCDRCGTSNLAWQQGRSGKWALCGVFNDAKTGEVVGGPHNCRANREIHDRMAATARAEAERVAALPAEVERVSGELLLLIGYPVPEVIIRSIAQKLAHAGRELLARQEQE